jgi:hypothetical protein
MARQITEAETRIPPIEFQNYPIDVRLRIYPTGQRYDLEIQAEGQLLRRPIDMTPSDLLALNKRLQQEIEATVYENTEGLSPTSNDLEAQILPLAETGGYAFRRIFSHPDAEEAIQTLVTRNGSVSIEITSEDFFLPWELIYPVSLDEPLSYEHFWGMGYVISRVIAKGVHSGAFVSPTIVVDSAPNFGLLTYGGLHSVAEQEIPFFRKLDEDHKIHLLQLRALDPHKKREELKEFQSFWSNALNVVHFAGHAYYEDGSPDLSYLLLSDEFRISLMDLVNYEIVLSDHPLVIMNACDTGNLNPLYTSYFAQMFLQYGARGVVATECTVPDAFAADFAERLYGHLLGGERLGQSLLDTRTYFLETYHNPTGLLYSMYAPQSIRLAQGGQGIGQ